MKTLWPYIRPIVFAAWVVAAIRLALEFALKPEINSPGWFVSVYYAMPLLLLWTGLRGSWDALSYPKMLGAFALVALLSFGVPNAVAYGTGQFQGWTHGRFRPPEPGKEGFGEDEKARAAPIKPTSAGKVGVALMIGGGTTIAGFVWTAALGTLLVYVPKRVRAGKSSRGATP
jgi:hypothetical protein